MHVCVCSWSFSCAWNDGRDGGGEIAAGTGPERQRNHLDELPHILPHFSVPQHACNGVAETRERGKACVSPENCGLTVQLYKPRFTMGPRILLVSKPDARGYERVDHEARDSHVNWICRLSSYTMGLVGMMSAPRGLRFLQPARLGPRYCLHLIVLFLYLDSHVRAFFQLILSFSMSA